MANFAKGFVDLNPKYEEARHQRAVNVAQRWKGMLGDKMKEKIKEEERKNFNIKIKSGYKLTLGDLKHLNDGMKSDYIKRQLMESAEVNEYVEKV